MDSWEVRPHAEQHDRLHGTAAAGARRAAVGRGARDHPGRGGGDRPPAHRWRSWPSTTASCWRRWRRSRPSATSCCGSTPSSRRRTRAWSPSTPSCPTSWRRPTGGWSPSTPSWTSATDRGAAGQRGEDPVPGQREPRAAGAGDRPSSGCTRLLRDPASDPLTAEQANQVELIDSSARTLLDLVNELLDLAKAESGRLEPVPDRRRPEGDLRHARGARCGRCRTASHDARWSWSTRSGCRRWSPTRSCSPRSCATWSPTA